MSLIYVECYGDTVLVEHVLGLEKSKQIQHSFGIGNISKKLENSTQALAMIDADEGKTKPNYIKNLKLFREFNYGICVLMDEIRENFIIQISPDLEGFLLKLVPQEKFLFEKFGIPMQPSALHSFLSLEKNSEKLKKFLIELEQTKTVSLLQELKKAFHKTEMRYDKL